MLINFDHNQSEGGKMSAVVKKHLDTGTTNAGESTDLSDYNIKIAELAYFKAESRNFEPGHELDDWLEAEQEVLH